MVGSTGSVMGAPQAGTEVSAPKAAKTQRMTGVFGNRRGTAVEGVRLLTGRTFRGEGTVDPSTSRSLAVSRVAADAAWAHSGRDGSGNRPVTLTSADHYLQRAEADEVRFFDDLIITRGCLL